MKHLVAGKGFIGSAVGEALEGEVKYLDRSTGDFQQDVTEEFSIDEEFDVLYHTIGLPPGFASRQAYQSIHVEGTRNLLEAVDADKVVYVSAVMCDIDHPFFRTKREAERLIRESDMEHTILRPSTVAGDGNKLMEMIKKFSFTRVFPEVPTKTQPVKLEDFVKAAVNVADSRSGETLNIAGPEKMTVTEMASRLYSQNGHSCETIPLPDGFLEDFLKLFGVINRPPFTRYNATLIGAENTVDENHAPQFTQLQDPF